MNAQEIFDTVVRHLGKQRAKALKEGSNHICMYRAFDGKKCALGILIQDNEYTPKMENRTAWGLKYEKLLPLRLVEHFDLIRELQDCHDDYPVEDWPLQLKTIAVVRDLISDAVSESFRDCESGNLKD